jgi:molybdenum cofactor cytidylyltransferase
MNGRPADRSRVSGVILAAGLARRFGAPKQLTVVDGRALVRRIADEACRSRLAEVIVVVGHEATAVQGALAGADVRIVENTAFQRGQSTSVRAGLAAVAPEALGAMFLVADQPALHAPLIDQLLDVFERTGGPIVVPAYGHRRGSPVTFARALFPELLALRGDTGGRPVIVAHPADVIEVAIGSEEPLADIDTPDDLARWLEAQRAE